MTPPSPSPRALAISDWRNRVLVSAATAWEITIKKALGKLHAPNDLVQQLATRRIASLDVTIEHALAVSDLAEYHTDPFDRLLVAQARAERLTLVTRDRNSARYDVDILAA